MQAFAHFAPVRNTSFLRPAHGAVCTHRRCSSRHTTTTRFPLMKTQVEDETETKTTRLFSNVALNERGELKRQKASEWSCAALIAVRTAHPSPPPPTNTA